MTGASCDVDVTKSEERVLKSWWEREYISQKVILPDDRTRMGHPLIYAKQCLVGLIVSSSILVAWKTRHSELRFLSERRKYLLT